MRSLLLLAVCSALPLAAQTASIVDILSDQSQVLVGRTLQLTAIVRDANGNPIPNAPVTWSVNQPTVSSISTTGLLSVKGLAVIRITARSGAATGEAAVQSIPSRLDISPGSLNADVGSLYKYSANAYDADDKPIPGVTFTWSVTSLRQGTSSLATIDSTGILRVTGEGGMFVFATYNYNEALPGLQRNWVVNSPVTASAPAAYNLSKRFSVLSQTRKNWTLRPRQSMLWSSDDGTLYFNASLGGLANGLVSWKDGNWNLISGGGVPHFGRGSTALEFRTHAITGDGGILSYEDTNINGTELNIGDVTGVAPFLNNNVPLGQTEATSTLYINRNSYNTNGYVMVRAAFRFIGDTITNTGLFRGQGNANELLINTQEKLAEVPSPFSVDTDFGIANDGTAFYSVTSGTARAFYKHDYNGRTKLLSVGDSILGSKVKSFLTGRTNEPATWFDQDGSATLGVLLEDNSQYYLQFAADGTMSSLRLTSQTGILWRQRSQGTLIYANPYNNKGNGIYLWQGSTLTPVYIFGTKIAGQTVQEVESGTIDVTGAITLMIRGDANPLLIVRMGATPWVLFEDGDQVPVEAPLNIFTFVGGARTGQPHVQAGGNSGSIGQFDGTDWNLTLGIGERMFGTTTMWFGGSYGTTYNMRKSPTGDIYFTHGLGIGKIAPGGPIQQFLAFPLKISTTITANAPSFVDANTPGTVLFVSSTNAGDSRIYLYSNGQPQEILTYSSTLATATVISGNIVSSYDSLALDDTGRVLAELRFRNVTLPSLCLWDGKTWSIVATPAVTKIGTHTVTALPNVNKASGNHIVSLFTVETGGNLAAEWDGSKWVILVDVTTIMPNGQNANSIAALEVNRNGDLLFQFANGVNSVVVKQGSTFKQVQDYFRPTPDGDWLLRTNAMDFRDDGTVYLLAVTAFDEVTLYQATPR